VGGGGNDDSPPKSTLRSEDELFRFSFSSFRDGECAFSSDMVEDRSELGKRSIRRKEFKHDAPLDGVRSNLTRAGVRMAWGVIFIPDASHKSLSRYPIIRHTTFRGASVSMDGARGDIMDKAWASDR